MKELTQYGNIEVEINGQKVKGLNIEPNEKTALCRLIIDGVICEIQIPFKISRYELKMKLKILCAKTRVQISQGVTLAIWSALQNDTAEPLVITLEY